MNSERALVLEVRSALTAACPSLRDGDPADAVGGRTPSFVASPASTQEAAALLAAAACSSAEASSVLPGEATNAGVTPATESRSGSASRTTGQAATSASLTAGATARSVSI